MSRNKELSKRFTELFNSDDVAAGAAGVLAEDVVFHGATPEDIQGVDGVTAYIAGYRRAFPDARSTVEAQVEEGDMVVTRWTARGTHTGPLGEIPATGNTYELGGVTIERIEDGRIAEVWVSKDDLGMMRQIGVLG